MRWGWGGNRNALKLQAKMFACTGSFLVSFHLAIALIAAAFMMILGATGNIITFESELDRRSHPDVS